MPLPFVEGESLLAVPVEGATQAPVIAGGLVPYIKNTGN